MKRFAVVIALLVIGGVLLIGCENKEAIEKMNKLTMENDSLKAEIMKYDTQVKELTAKVTELTPVVDTTKAPEPAKKGEVKKAEPAKKETPAAGTTKKVKK